jgi:hypothetical protein
LGAGHDGEMVVTEVMFTRLVGAALMNSPFTMTA